MKAVLLPRAEKPEVGMMTPPERSTSVASAPVLVCVDASESGWKLIPYAKAMAEALKAPLTLLHVLELPACVGGPADPVEWSIRRQAARGHVRRVAGERNPKLSKLDVRIAEGRPVDQICRCMRELEAPISVVGTKTDENAVDWELGETTRKLLDRSCGALLLVPPSPEAAAEVHYRRLLVPLDGSRMAESVLPLAARLARTTGAEVLLAHVIPSPELTEIGPLEADDQELRRQVGVRNERVARKYVERMGKHLTCSEVAVRSRIVRNGDVRSGLVRLSEQERIDLVVMSAHGHSSRPDVACGSVAAYLVTHARTPILMVMGVHAHQGNHTANHQRSGRLPRDLVS
jgi:nucleotide-binding universal stress UspA family protein